MYRTYIVHVFNNGECFKCDIHHVHDVSKIWMYVQFYILLLAELPIKQQTILLMTYCKIKKVQQYIGEGSIKKGQLICQAIKQTNSVAQLESIGSVAQSANIAFLNGTNGWHNNKLTFICVTSIPHKIFVKCYILVKVL